MEIHGFTGNFFDYAFIQYETSRKKIKIYTFDIKVTSNQALI
jgi:hypothetical protein